MIRAFALLCLATALGQETPNETRTVHDALETSTTAALETSTTAASETAPRVPAAPARYAVAATLRAYSVEDPIDRKHRERRSPATRYLTSTGTDARKGPGLAGPPGLSGSMVIVVRVLDRRGLPPVAADLIAKPLRVDDTGGMLRRRVANTGELHLEIRLPTHKEAVAFGVRQAIVSLDLPWPVIGSSNTAHTGTTERKTHE